MANVPTQLDLFQAGRREALFAPTRFNSEIIDVDGSDINVLLNVAATMGEDASRYLQVGFNNLFLSTATGDDLDRWVYDRYQLVRKSAQSAVVTLRLTRTDTLTGVTVPRGSTFATSGGQVFETSNNVIFGAGNGGPIDVRAVAQRTGTAGNVAADTVTLVTASLRVRDMRVTNPTLRDALGNITSPGGAAGGREPETDDELRERARQFFVNARRGTKSAIEFGALQNARVSQADAVELLSSSQLPNYRVQLTIADAQGQANTALSQEVTESLDEFRALGVPVTVINAVPEFVNIELANIQFAAGANTAGAIVNARAAVLSAVNATEPNAPLRRSTILAALERVEFLIVSDNSLVEPAGDLVPTRGTVIRTTENQIVINV